LREELATVMAHRKRWISSLDAADKRKFLEGVNKIVVQLRESGKEMKAEVAAAGSVEGQNLLRIREVQALEASAAAAKRTADALEAQGDDLRAIRRCLVGIKESVSRPALEGRPAGLARRRSF
jgi:hypothetical protein